MSRDSFIDQQIEKLPRAIGEFTRRFLCLPDGSCVVQYTTRGFYLADAARCPSESSDCDVLYSERGEDVEQVVEKILFKIELDQRLENMGSASEPFVHIDQELTDQGVTPISLIRPACTATMMGACTPLPPSYSQIYFLVQIGGYLLSFVRKGNKYYFRRNDIIVYLPIPPRNAITAQQMAIAVSWKTEEIGITGYLSSHEYEGTTPKWTARSRDWKETAATVPPNSLYVWARRRLLISERSYARPGQVFNVVLDALQALNEDISVLCDLAGFWDEQREGNKVVSLIPKREPIVTRHIESRLRDITMQKNIDIMREVEIGNSKLDLLFSAPLVDGSNVKVCVEVKMAHAGDLAHGLATQLPEYMRRLGTDYGVYCVVRYGDGYEHQVEPFRKIVNPLNFESSIELYRSNLGVLLNAALSRLPFRNVAAVTIDASRRLSASQM